MADHNLVMDGVDCDGSQCVDAGVRGWSFLMGVPDDHWCAECEGRGWVYAVAGEDTDEIILGLAQALTHFADNYTTTPELDEALRNLGEDLRLHRADDAADRADAANEDAIWRAGCG